MRAAESVQRPAFLPPSGYALKDSQTALHITISEYLNQLSKLFDFYSNIFMMYGLSHGDLTGQITFTQPQKCHSVQCSQPFIHRNPQGFIFQRVLCL